MNTSEHTTTVAKQIAASQSPLIVVKCCNDLCRRYLYNVIGNRIVYEGAGKVKLKQQQAEIQVQPKDQRILFLLAHHFEQRTRGLGTFELYHCKP